jgi:hypothetical protein
MKRATFFTLSLLTIFSVAFTASAVETKGQGRADAKPEFSQWHPDNILRSSGRVTSFKNGVSADTLCIYGGPGSLLGKFQQADLITPDSQSWTEHDPTDQPTLWQRSTFNMGNLNGHGGGNFGMWAGQTSAQQPGYASAPGYGNNWNALIEYRTTVSNPAVGQTVSLDLVLNYETEGGFDFLTVEYDSAGASKTVLNLSGTNKVVGNIFPAPGVVYSSLTPGAITFESNSYSGPGNDEIIIRMRATSDGGWSDEDGLNPTTAGHSQIDDITVTHLDGTDIENFEGAGPYEWNPEKAPFAGFFGKFFSRVTDLDPCRDAESPVMGFVDDGTPPSNPSYTGTGTGGTTSDNWSYGVPGGWVTNYNGGLSLGALSSRNEFWSPPIQFDLPGPADDGIDFAGLFYKVSVYEHLPLTSGNFWQWHVRGSTDGGVNWSPWANRSFVYFSGTPRWVNNNGAVGDLVPPGPTHVQFRLLWRDDAALFAFAGTDATPSPFMDNFSVQKYRVSGPTFASRNIDLFNDGFAQSGATSLSSQVMRDQMDVRIDMARDVNSGVTFNVPGDSIIVDVSSVIPGVAITDSLNQISMHYSLNMNPLFESGIRANAPVTGAGTGTYGWDQSEGTINPTQSVTSTGVAIADRYAFDFPDENFMYPGDVLEYYIRAIDDDARTTTFPASIAGFDDTSTAYLRTFTVRGLPTFTNTDGDTPDILLVNDFGRRGGENDYLQAFGQLGLQEGVHFDTYTVMGPSSNVSNGIGSSGAHGATSDQLRGYNCVIYVNGDLSGNGLSDGSSTGNNDKGDDVGALTGWVGQNADRSIAHFGDYIASHLSASGSSGQNYLSSVMGVQYVSNDVRPTIDNQTAPRVIPTGAVVGFTEQWIAYGGCLAINRFDHITPGGGAVSSHGFEILGSPGSFYGGSSAGVITESCG